MTLVPAATVKGGGRPPTFRDLSSWKAAKSYGAASKPVQRDYAPGSWVSWTTPRGQLRTGVVTSDPFTVAAAKRAAEVGGAKDARTRVAVIPADGGEALPLCLPDSNHPETLIKESGRWRPVRPAHTTTKAKAAA